MASNKEWEEKAIIITEFVPLTGQVYKPVPPYTWTSVPSIKAHLMTDSTGMNVGYVGWEHCGCDPKEHHES